MIPKGNASSNYGSLAAGITAPIEVLARFNTSSVPIEKHYMGPDAGLHAAAVVVNGYSLDSKDGNVYGPGGTVVLSGPHPESNVLDFPDLDGPPSVPQSAQAALLQSYVKYAYGQSNK